MLGYIFYSWVPAGWAINGLSVFLQPKQTKPRSVFYRETQFISINNLFITDNSNYSSSLHNDLAEFLHQMPVLMQANLGSVPRWYQT